MKKKEYIPEDYRYFGIDNAWLDYDLTLGAVQENWERFYIGGRETKRFFTSYTDLRNGYGVGFEKL